MTNEPIDPEPPTTVFRRDASDTPDDSTRATVPKDAEPRTRLHFGAPPLGKEQASTAPAGNLRGADTTRLEIDVAALLRNTPDYVPRPATPVIAPAVAPAVAPAIAPAIAKHEQTKTALAMPVVRQAPSSLSAAQSLPRTPPAPHAPKTARVGVEVEVEVEATERKLRARGPRPIVFLIAFAVLLSAFTGLRVYSRWTTPVVPAARAGVAARGVAAAPAAPPVPAPAATNTLEPVAAVAAAVPALEPNALSDLEKRALDRLVANDHRSARTLYAQLAAMKASSPEYAQMLRLLDRKLAFTHPGATP